MSIITCISHLIEWLLAKYPYPAGTPYSLHRQTTYTVSHVLYCILVVSPVPVYLHFERHTPADHLSGRVVRPPLAIEVMVRTSTGGRMHVSPERSPSVEPRKPAAAVEKSPGGLKRAVAVEAVPSQSVKKGKTWPTPPAAKASLPVSASLCYHVCYVINVIDTYIRFLLLSNAVGRISGA